MSQTACPPELVAELRRARRVWVGTHEDPDGDAYGSLLALGRMLRALGKEVTLACQDPAPREADHLPGAGQVMAEGPGAVDLAIALDAGDAGRLGRLHDAAVWSALPTAVIDHHRSNPGFGRWNWVVPDAAATCQMLTELAMAESWPVDPLTANCLLCGILTDSIGFRTSNTSAATLQAAAALLGLGADLPGLSQRIFGRLPLGGLRLIGRAIDRLRVEDGIALTWLDEADLSALGARPGDGKEVTRLLSQLDEARILAILRDKGQGVVDLSLRAKPGIDLLPVAAALGGGGHPQAAGARLKGSLAEAEERVRAALAGLPSPSPAVGLDPS